MPSCAVCKTRRAVHRHHLVKQQKIRARWRSKRYSGLGEPPYKLSTALNDPRLWIWVCGLDGCHVEEVPVPIPDGFWAAVDEYGLEPDLPRWLHGRQPTASGIGIKQNLVGGALVDAQEADMRAARDGYNPNW